VAVHGTLRVAILNRRLGDRRARPIGVFTRSVASIVIVWVTMPWIEATTSSQCLMIGLLWSLLMLGFDIAFGRYYFHFAWRRIAADFDPRKGGLLGLGMATLFFTPVAVTKRRGLL
jgi:hypothetical protein